MNTISTFLILMPGIDSVKDARSPGPITCRPVGKKADSFPPKNGLPLPYGGLTVRVIAPVARAIRYPLCGAGRLLEMRAHQARWESEVAEHLVESLLGFRVVVPFGEVCLGLMETFEGMQKTGDHGGIERQKELHGEPTRRRQEMRNLDSDPFFMRAALCIVAGLHCSYFTLPSLPFSISYARVANAIRSKL